MYKRRLVTWAEDVGLNNHRLQFAAGARHKLCSRVSGSNIDHILTGWDVDQYEVVRGWNNTGTVWSGDVADHFPIVMEVLVSSGRGAQNMVCPVNRQLYMPGLEPSRMAGQVRGAGQRGFPAQYH